MTDGAQNAQATPAHARASPRCWSLTRGAVTDRLHVCQWRQQNSAQMRACACLGHWVSVGGSGRGAPPSRVHEPHSDPPAPPPRLPRLPHPSYMRCRSISLSLAPSTPSEPPARPRPSLLRPAPTSGVLRVVAPSIRVVPASAEGHAHPARVCPRHRAHSLSLGMATDPMLADPTRGPCLALGCGLRARLCAPPASQPRQPRQPSPPWGSRLGAHALGQRELAREANALASASPPSGRL